MRSKRTLSRRQFVGVVAVVPGAVVFACGSSEEGASKRPVGGDAATGGSAGDASVQSDGAPDAVSTEDAPVDATPEHVCGAELPRIDLKLDCGAVGDGTTNDTAAFQKAAEQLTNAKGGELVIPAGVYIVGKQTPKTDPTAAGPFYVAEDIFKVTGVSCLLVRGYGATLKVEPGLHFGGFDTAGKPKDVVGQNQNEAAHVGRVIEIVDSSNVSIEGLEIDGNAGALVLGGQWGDVDRQTSATGIWVNRCSELTIADVRVHHHALDGITVLHQKSKPTAPKPHYIRNTVSEYNGRQAISWIGGWGLECTDCKFNHTGRALNGDTLVSSKPGAGLDIEPNGGAPESTRGGLFTRCEFVDNTGPGVVTAGGDSGYAKFVECTFWGTTSYSVWVPHPGMEFVNSTFHGTGIRGSDGSSDSNPTPDPTLATRFDGCTFEDLPWTDGKVHRSGTLYTLSDAGATAGVTWKNCTFINHEVRAIVAADPTSQEIFDGCTFTFSNTALSAGTYQADFLGSRIVSCRFEDSGAVASGTKHYFIRVENVEVGTPATGAPATHVEGPNVKWGSASATGTLGDIAPGTYP